MSSSEAPKTWLSQDAYDRLQAELDELIAGRPAIAAEINARREEGDLRENGGYHAAREEQSRQEGRILYLKEFLRNSEVGEVQAADSVVPGSVVTIYFDDDQADTETFLLGSREISSTTDLTVYSPESALGKAILGARPGQTVTYTAPSGADIKVTVVKFGAFEG
ncbi:transcription elongation factor GreA [Actinoplanes sp. SE50]|uniref:Transcription elongation factor GreA n=1 Tax=Actinoplanes ianthinogenes TaxID=122358 RepID=A0ABM7LYR5_9ACTN|nr:MULTISPECIES: transcription elongation factor GreA [Actinoplanes]AEV81865.1 Transcription elongation factor greA [Actinoplanes sp. SE50/110]ATO80266.1 transcription elongation factor GreA [Actinoplanes sp. SE50]SLL97671.1 transcription elongation factor GreA [Actinoplanes sp. SE50/110]BCJ44475.1 transcription elongation factor GreA [Actinoplanes ianthinogenes]GGQ98187.1 transcription elongation factor GreA [Actinoplanes ianthinogenes]